MDSTEVDLLIIGGGPSGIAASIYAGGYGLNTVVIEPNARDLVGRAGTSPHLENCPGFNYGISGFELSHKLREQARNMNVRFVRGEVQALVNKVAKLNTGENFLGRAVLIATGRTPNKLNVAGAEKYWDHSVFNEPPLSARDMRNKRICVVGGGNPAGQVAGYLSRLQSTFVHLVLPQTSITMSAGAGMSQYLSKRLLETANVEIHLQSKVTAVHGDGISLTDVTVSTKSRGTTSVAVDEVYAFVGSTPNTDWIRNDIDSNITLHPDGRIMTHRASLGRRFPWQAERSPFGSETPVLGVFAAGDVCVDGMGTILGAYGHAAMALKDICAYLRL